MCYCNNAIMTFAESNDNRLGIEKEVYGSRSVLQCTVVKRDVCYYCTLLKAFKSCNYPSKHDYGWTLSKSLHFQAKHTSLTA